MWLVEIGLSMTYGGDYISFTLIVPGIVENT
jgi:hypothetical protein